MFPRPVHALSGLASTRASGLGKEEEAKAGPNSAVSTGTMPAMVKGILISKPTSSPYKNRRTAGETGV